MNTPVADFLREYASSDMSRLHMPGHKGAPFLGCEHLDITEVDGADVLRRADGILRESQDNATALFGTRCTRFATGGSSECVRAMLYLATVCRSKNALPIIIAARNVHQTFVYGAALLDLTPVWLWPEQTDSVCVCPVTPQSLEKALSSLSAPPAGVYVTSPDYLGNRQPIRELADICHKHETILLVDNAHGAYLRFLPESQHPMDCGADLCCDSAHKTLPVLTGGAYLHISRTAPVEFSRRADEALSLFGSTSPSYLTLGSLDLANPYLAGAYPAELCRAVAQLGSIKAALSRLGWYVAASDPLRLTIHASVSGISGEALAARLREHKVECEFADRDYLVLMATPQNSNADFDRVLSAFGMPPAAPASSPAPLPAARCEAVLTPRQALFAPHETVPAAEAAGRICANPVVGFPPPSQSSPRASASTKPPSPCCAIMTLRKYP